MNSNQLKIDFFGEGYGETIFLELPNGKIGIVDCGNKLFIQWFTKYVEKKNISTIDFIVWTHPHADHTSSFPDLFGLCEDKNITIKHFMRFGIRQFQAIAELIEVQCNKETTHENIIEQATLNETIYAHKFTPSDLKKTIDRIKLLKQRNLIEKICNSLNYGHSLFSLNDLDKDIEIFCLAPTDENINFYYEKTNEWARKKLQSKEFSLNSSLHNIISVALCIKYGDISIILGGDVLKDTWESILNENRHQTYSHNPLKMIKVPHHGSDTAYVEEIWNKWGNDIYSVICPLVRYPLPKTSDIDNFLEHTKNIFILKDKNISTLLNHICTKSIGCEYKKITEDKDATNHISFQISKEGEINHQWL